jgi:hypothetical protein
VKVGTFPDGGAIQGMFLLRLGGFPMLRRIMETHKPGRVTKVVNAAGEDQIQVSPSDPLVGELLVANILGDAIGKPIPEKANEPKE